MGENIEQGNNMGKESTEICQYHIQLVEKMGEVKGTLDTMNLMLKDSLTKQEGFLKKIDEHNVILTQHSNQLVRVEDVNTKLKDLDSRIDDHDSDLVVLKENKQTKSAYIAIVFSALVTVIGHYIEKIFSKGN